MGTLQLSQIEHRLRSDIVPSVDASDLSNHDEAERDVNVLSRATSAFALSRIWGWSPEDSCGAITDGPNDGGLDLIAIEHSPDPRLVLAQGKWSQSGAGGASLADMLKFKEGVDRLIQNDKSYFSQAIQDRWPEIEAAIFNPRVRIDLVFAHSGSGQLAEKVRAALDPLLEDLNEQQPVADFRYLNQAALHAMLLTEDGRQIDIEVELSDFGVIEEPIRAYYGHVAAQDVAAWWDEHRDRLFSRNLRSTLPDSEVNEGIYETVTRAPAKFWFYNNGVTALCSSFRLAPSGSDRRVGKFQFSGVQIVNGAQTVGSIGRAAATSDQELSANARVMVRFIELEGADDGFGSEVTRWTNTQNRVGGRDFLALDPEQTRIASEFEIDGRQYVFRSGEADPVPNAGCGVQEATVALACVRGDVRLAVQAKREVSRLWADIERAPYKQLFNPSTTSHVIWRSVQVLRCVDEAVQEVASEETGRKKSLATYLNRLALWTVATHCGLAADVGDDETTWQAAWTKVTETALPIVQLLVDEAEQSYPGYPANLAKNATECERLANLVLDELTPA